MRICMDKHICGIDWLQSEIYLDQTFDQKAFLSAGQRLQRNCVLLQYSYQKTKSTLTGHFMKAVTVLTPITKKVLHFITTSFFLLYVVSKNFSRRPKTFCYVLHLLFIFQASLSAWFKISWTASFPNFSKTFLSYLPIFLTAPFSFFEFDSHKTGILRPEFYW